MATLEVAVLGSYLSLNAEEAGPFTSSLPLELKPKMITFKESEKE